MSFEYKFKDKYFCRNLWSSDIELRIKDEEEEETLKGALIATHEFMPPVLGNKMNGLWHECRNMLIAVPLKVPCDSGMFRNELSRPQNRVRYTRDYGVSIINHSWNLCKKSYLVRYDHKFSVRCFHLAIEFVTMRR